MAPETTSSLVRTPSALLPLPTFGAVPGGLTAKALQDKLGQGSAVAGTGAANIARYDFGAASPLDAPRIEADFTLRNDSSETLSLERLQPSCHCTSAVIGQGETGGEARMPAALPPGAQTSVHVRVDLQGQGAGPLTKFVLVYVQGRPQPAAVLQITGTLLPTVTFTPPVLNFGTVEAGEAHALTLTTRIDRRLLGQGGAPALATDNPAVKIAKLPEKASKPDKTGHFVTQAYSVSVAPDAPISAVNGVVFFAPPADARTGISLPAGGSASVQGKTKITPAAWTYLRSAQALLLGRVIGSVAAAPDVVSFGTITLGTFVNRHVALTGKTAGDVRGITVKSLVPWITAQLKPASANSPAAAADLQVTVSAQAPAGAFQVPLTVTLPGGRIMLLPVTGYVMPSPLTNAPTGWPK